MRDLEYDKRRFDYLKKVTRGWSSLRNPFSGKNKKQRERLGSAFRAMQSIHSRAEMISLRYIQ
jgi:hypothetical protein